MNGRLQPFEVRCVSEDKFSTPVVGTADTTDEALDVLLAYHDQTKVSLKRLGVFDTVAGHWVENNMPQVLYARP